MPTGLSRFSFCVSVQQAGTQSSSAPSLVCVIWDQMQRANWQWELEGWSSVKVTGSCLSSDCSSEKRGKWSVCFLYMFFFCSQRSFSVLPLGVFTFQWEGDDGRVQKALKSWPHSSHKGRRATEDSLARLDSAERTSAPIQLSVT